MPKTPFDQLLRVRKHAVQTLQKEYDVIRMRVQSCAEELEALAKALEQCQPPQEGTMQELSSHNLTTRLYRRQIGETLERFAALQRQAALIRQDMKAASIESEKIDHLRQEEQLRILKRISRIEGLRLDEAGLMAHAWQHRGGA